MKTTRPSEGNQDPSASMIIGTSVTIPRSELRFTFSRSSGPGGQAVNKLSTRAQLRVRVSAIGNLPPDAQDRLRKLAGKRLTSEDEILIEAETFRSQLDNKMAALERLAGLVRESMIRPKPRKRKKPSRSMTEKRLDSKKRTGERKRLRQQRLD